MKLTILKAIAATVIAFAMVALVYLASYLIDAEA